MIVVTGGVASGKRTFVRSLGFSDNQMADAVIDDRPVVYNLQDLVLRNLDASGAEGLIDSLACKRVVICDEVGCGVVPMGPGERAARERTGRLVIELSSRAELVVRMVCGIPVVLKGELPEGVRP